MPGGSDPSATAKARLSLRTVRTGYLLVAVGLVAAFFAVPAGRIAVALLIGAVTAAAIGLGVARLRPKRWLGWLLLGVAVATTTATITTFAAIGSAGPARLTYPQANEITHLATTPVLAAALIVLGRPAIRSRNLGMILDVAGLSLTNALIVWIALLRPATIQDGISTTARVITFANFIGTMIVFTAGVRVALSWHRVGALRWLVVGVLAFVTAAAVYAGQLTDHVVYPAGPSSGAFMVFMLCCGAAALTPSMAEVRSDERGQGHVGAIGVAALGLCMVVVPAALLFDARLGPVTNAVAFAVAFAGLGGIAVARLTLVGRHRRRAAEEDEQDRYFRALVQSSPDATLVSRDGVVQYATPAAADLFGRDVRGVGLDDLVDRGPGRHRARADGRSASSRAEDDGYEGYEGQVRRSDSSTVIVMISERDLTDDPHVTGVVTTLRDITVERTRQLDLAFRATHDPLTRLANRESFHHQLRAQPLPAAEPVARAVLYVDLDDFKTINDTYGHDVGDRVLEEVARRIESCLRSGDLAARLGGDEFAVLLNQVPDERAAQSVAQRITEALSAAAVVDDLTLSCRASVGLAYGPDVSMARLREADMALYAAKAAGKGRWHQYHDDMGTAVPRSRPCPDE
jgi:diguanylate cyclase (GGDEF)-like protein/PAS domain S-box-containing protein